MKLSLTDQLNETVEYIKSFYTIEPSVAIILGSGLGNLTKDMVIKAEIDYAQLPHFPVSTVKGHSGKLIFGKINDKDVVVMNGRFHFYEGYSALQVTYPVRVLKMIGVKTLFISNAAGGVNADFNVGDLMIINDHISLFINNPLVGKNEDELGTRFPDMSEPYDKTLIIKAKEIAKSFGYIVKEGVYCGVTGPTFETKAEYKLIKLVGADAVGMSTVQEVITAIHAGIKVFAISIITDLGIREENNVITHEEVLAAANEAEPKLSAIFKELVTKLG